MSIKMLHRKVTTNFYLDSDESYALVKQFLPVLEKRLQDKGYNCELNVNSGSKQMNFVAGFLKRICHLPVRCIDIPLTLGRSSV